MSIIASGSPTQAELDFQAKMQERLRQSFGDLMPDEVLRGIVARGIEEAFFKERIKRTSWGRDEIEPSWVTQFVKKEAETQVRIAVEKWVSENTDKVKAILDERLSHGLASAVLKAFDEMFSGVMFNLRQEIAEKMSALRNG